MRSKCGLYCLFLLLSTPAFPQNSFNDIYLLFYNVENLFDTKNDPLTEDEVFTPEGDRRWTNKRLNHKLLNISKVILSASDWTPPQLIGLCEVENYEVLNKLLHDTPLQKFPYRIIHKESPDSRGIDVALIYNSEEFYPLDYSYIPIKDENGKNIKSREILYVKGIIGNTDTLHLLINHWPSRYSGLLESNTSRINAAHILRQAIDSIQKKHFRPAIIATGDFNDQPTDKSITSTLKAKAPDFPPEHHTIYNLSAEWITHDIQTLKYQSQWSVFDQIMVSGSLLTENNKLHTKPDWAEIVKLPFLLVPDEKFAGKKLNRTYIGFKYNGGYSDHLPVRLRIRYHP